MTEDFPRKADSRLIERWLPIAMLGEECVRERRSLQALPPVYYLHVWWARRPLVASRAAILASVLPADADRSRFLHAIGIHGDAAASRRRIDAARQKGERFEGEAYSYKRAFSHSLDADDHAFIADGTRAFLPDRITVLDPTAGGGSIPFESVRLGFGSFGNDLNPVACLVEKATIEYPMRHGSALLPVFEQLANEFVTRREKELQSYFPSEPEPNCIPTNYLWSRTIRCPYCEGLVPLSPNWRLAPNGTGVRLQPRVGTGPGDLSRICDFIIVWKLAEHSAGTVADGDGLCPFPDCGRPIDGNEIKRQAQAGKMGEQLFAVVFKRRIETTTKSGKRGRVKWERGYRAPRSEDDNSAYIGARLAEKIEEWDTLDFVPSESIGELSNYDRGHRMYGMHRWTDMFSPRQILGHGTGVQIFRELLEERRKENRLDDVTKAAFVYLAISLDKFLNWNARQATWNVNLEGTRSVFDTHNFSMKWTFAEMATLIVGVGYDWVIGQVGKCIGELVGLIRPDTKVEGTLLQTTPVTLPPLTISCKSSEALDHLDDASVDVVVMDPPYYDNVMYAELSDFFYVWLKRTAGHVVPELFTRQLTDKDNEAVANPAKFAGERGAKALAGRDYKDRMARIFEECRRVLKVDGIMTLMFTHKATGAWDALTKGLMQAGFTITASWPINTEAEGSLHIKNKSAANSTIFLVCRPRSIPLRDAEVSYWEDIEPAVARAVRARVQHFQEAGITGVDLYLASFGPALEEFSRHWPLRRGTPRPTPLAKRRRQQAEMFDEDFDPYAVTPEDALEAARREVKRWRLEQLTHMKANEELDPLTSFFVLAWDAFRAPVFPYDEALRLARAVGVDLDTQVVGVLCEKKGGDLLIWDSSRRAARGALGSPDGRRAMIDAVHHAAHIGRTRTLGAAAEMLAKAGVDREQMFLAALEAVLEVLPVSKAFSGIELDGDLDSASSDFEALENLRKLAFSEQVDEPKQLELWQENAAE